MRVSVGVPLTIALCVAALLSPARAGLAQAPTAENQPRLARPAQGTAIQPVRAVIQDSTPTALPPGQPTAAPAPEPVTQVTGPAAGVTPLPNSTATSTTSSSSQAVTAGSRTYSAARFGLALEGVDAGMVNRVAGGTPTADVVVERPGPNNIVGKHVAGLKYEDLSFTTDLSSRTLTDWISATLSGSVARKNGSVIGADYSGKAVSELQFFNAIISGVTFPALDAGSRDAGSISVSIAPEYTRPKAGSGTIASQYHAQKKWMVNSFSFEMAGLDGSRVNHIDAITIGQKSDEHAVGELRDYEKTPSGLVIPNLTLTLSESGSQGWADWVDDFLVKGNNSNDKERSGSIVYMDAARSELGRLNLLNCGIVRLAPKGEPAATDSIRRLQAELYCERMELSVK
jgi:T4-like virus tail tube protein gp19